MIGIGHASGHHGELLQGIFLDDAGKPCRGLVTLPTPHAGVHAEYRRCADLAAGHVVVDPPDRTKAAKAAVLAVAECAARVDVPATGGRLHLRGHLPVGLGMGSSSADIIATIRAVAACYRCVLSPTDIARIAVRAETASDPLMHDGQPVLFAQREGRILEDLGASLPPLAVVGCCTGGGRPVDTLALRPEYGPADLARFERLRARLRAAIRAADPAGVGEVCTASSLLNQRVLPKAELATLQEIGDDVGAVGVQVAHSGNVAGLLFDATRPDLAQQLHSCRVRLRRAGIPPTRTFRVRQHSAQRSPQGPAHAWTSNSATKEDVRARPHQPGHRHPRPGAARGRARLPEV